MAKSPLTQLKPMFQTLLSRVVAGWRWLSARTTAFMTGHPLLSFFGALAIMVALVVVGNWLRRPPATAPTVEIAPKAVSAYTLGADPTITVQAKVDKSGVISIVAQTAGVVSKVNVTEGQTVTRGQRLVSLASTYTGLNAASLTRQLSQRNYQHVVDTYDTQAELIKQNKELAEKNEIQAKELRAINRDSQDETRSLIDLNEEIIHGLDEQIADLEGTNVNGANDAAITQIKASKSQALAGLNGLKQGLKTSEYVNDEEKEVAGMTGLVKATTLKQLDLQQKALDLNKDIAQLNVRLAQVGEALMYPATPCKGVVERVHVTAGQMVSPGTVIATIKAQDSTATLEVLVAAPIADQVSRLVPSTIMIGQQKIEIVPRHVSTEPTSGTLHSVLFTLPSTAAGEVTDGQFVTVTLVLGAGVTQESYIPLDAVFYSQSGAYVFVADTTQTPARAAVRKVQLGQVFGQMVEVLGGLDAKTTVILDRTVVDTDPVQVQPTVAK